MENFSREINEVLNLKLSLKKAIVFLLSLYGIVFVLSFLIVGPNALFDYQTLLLSLSILFFLIFIIKFSREHIFAQNVILAGFFSVYVIPRLIVYLLFPEIVVFPFESEINLYQVNNALLYVLVGSMCVVIGFILAKNIFRLSISPTNSHPEPVAYNPLVILTVFLLSVISVWFVQEVMGVSHLARTGEHNVLAQLLSVIFNIDMIFFMGCATFLFKSLNEKKAIFLTILIITVYFAYFTVNGSRGMALRIVTMIFAMILCKIGNFKVLFKHVIFIFCFLLLSYCLFAFATQKRMDKVKKYSAGSSAGVSFYTDNDEKPKELFSKIMGRIGLIDNAIMMLSISADPSAKSKYMNLSYAGKNILNLILPGVVFKEAEISTSRVIPVLYRNFSDEYLKGGGYYSDFYTAWGIFFLVFGWWAGWFMLLVAGICVHFTYLLIMRFGGKFRYHMGALCLLLLSNSLYLSMGIDHWIANAVMILGSGAIALFLFKLVEFIFRGLFMRKSLVIREYNEKKINSRRK